MTLAPEDWSITVGPHWLQGQKFLSMSFVPASERGGHARNLEIMVVLG